MTYWSQVLNGVLVLALLVTLVTWKAAQLRDRE